MSINECNQYQYPKCPSYTSNLVAGEVINRDGYQQQTLVSYDGKSYMPLNQVQAEHFGSFSISAAVRPTSCNCRGNHTHSCTNRIPGV